MLGETGSITMSLTRPELAPVNPFYLGLWSERGPAFWVEHQRRGVVQPAVNHAPCRHRSLDALVLLGCVPEPHRVELPGWIRQPMVPELAMLPRSDPSVAGSSASSGAVRATACE